MGKATPDLENEDSRFVKSLDNQESRFAKSTESL